MENNESNMECNKRIEKIFSNTSYIELLIKMTSDINYIWYKGIYDIYVNKDIESTEYELSDLRIFYSGIDRFAKKTNLKSYNSTLSKYYVIKYLNNYFRVGQYKFAGDITYFFAREEKIDYDEEEEEHIDIMDVINSYISVIELNKLSDLIVTLHSKGFLVQEIEKKVQETLRKLQNTTQNETPNFFLEQEEKDIDRAVKTLSKFKK